MKRRQARSVTHPGDKAEVLAEMGPDVRSAIAKIMACQHRPTCRRCEHMSFEERFALDAWLKVRIEELSDRVVAALYRPRPGTRGKLLRPLSGVR